MKNLILTLLTLTPICMFSQISDYTVASYLEEGNKAPNMDETDD